MIVRVEKGMSAMAKAERRLIPVMIPGSAMGRITRSEIVSRPKNLARAMVTGYRRGTPDSGDVRPLVGVGVTLAAAIVGFLAWNLASNVPIAGDVTARLGNAEHSGHSELAEEPESDDD